MLTKILLFSYVSYAMYRTVQSGTSYDQSQSGDLNVQVDLKGLHIIALMKGGKEEYVDYDYAYDYSEMTIKPLNGTSTTAKPLNATSTVAALEKDNATTTTAAATSAIATAYEETTLQPSTATDSFTKPPLDSRENATSVEGGTIDNFNVTTPAPQSFNVTSNSFNSTNSCRKGFVLNQKGECELKMQNSSTNALLKLVRLSQKLKLRRERKPTIVHNKKQGQNTA